MKESFLIQKMSGGDVRATSEWGIEVVSYPVVPRGREVKELPNNDWYDEHGLDEYIPDVLPMKEYEIEVGFVYHGEPNTGMSQVNQFLSFLANGGSNKIYSSRIQQGRRDVRLKSVDVTGEAIDSGCDDVVLFTVVFQVNDPITEVTLSYGE